ncbi:MAG: hypothetical protein JO197_15430 [Acidobacteria bacterium]|nr:hypothetical protein [Acidobacteriota bacterium]MBV9475086.1 hypothetical protein [Acidobacteriota bacterium]
MRARWWVYVLCGVVAVVVFAASRRQLIYLGKLASLFMLTTGVMLWLAWLWVEHASIQSADKQQEQYRLEARLSSLGARLNDLEDWLSVLEDRITDCERGTNEVEITG